MLRCSAREIARLVNRREVAPHEVLAVFERRIAGANPILNAVVGGRHDGLDVEVAEVARRLADGERLPLAAVPVIVKDTVWVRGRTVTQGSLLFRDFVAPVDAIAVDRLRAAGAVPIGMGNSSEFACKGVTTNRVYGDTRHPMDPALTPGGSSGGCAVGVAAHMAPLALGTDGGGSSRRPPAHVGVVGFKPSFGAVPDSVGFAHVFDGLQVVAPIARSVGDASLVFDAISGYLARDPDSVPPAAGPRRAMTRAAYSPTLGLRAPVDQDVAAAVSAAVAAIGSAGVRVDEIEPNWPRGAAEPALAALQETGLAELYGRDWQRRAEDLDADIASQIERGYTRSGVDVASARRVGRAVGATMAGLLSDWDVLICPTTPCVAWPADRLGPAEIGGRPVSPRAHAVFTPFVNHAGACAITLPCGSGRDGLPVGLQLIAARGRDRELLDFAGVVERAVEHLLPKDGFRCAC